MADQDTDSTNQPVIPAKYNFSGVDQLNKEESYQTIPQQALSFVEGVGSGLTLDATKYLEEKSGLTTLKDIEERERLNPASSIAGLATGAAAFEYFTAGAGTPLETAALGKKAVQAGKVATEAALEGGASLAAAETAGRVAAQEAAGVTRAAAARGLNFGSKAAAYSAGTNIVDATLLDKPLNGQKMMAEMGLNFALGAGLGVLSKGVEAKLGQRAQEAAEASKITDVIKDVDVPASVAEEAGIPSSSVYDAPSGAGVKPTSLEDMERRIKDAAYRGETTELPQAQELRDAAARVEMLNPVIDPQIESVTNQQARNAYGIAKESDTKAGQIINQYEALQKAELAKRNDLTIKNIAVDHEPIADATKNGEQVIKMFTDKNKAEKEELGKLFKKLKEISTEDPFNHIPGVIDEITKNPKYGNANIARMFDTTGDELVIKPYRTQYGIDKSTYTAMKQVVESLKEEPAIIEDLMNLRKGMAQNIDILAQGDAPREIRNMRAAMLDYIQKELEKEIGSKRVEGLTVREIFKRYAINEQEREVIERVFGASVGSPEFGAISKIKPEEVTDKIFRNTATVKAARQILGEEQFNKILANHLAEQVAKVTDKGAFSSNKFGTFLKRNIDTLNEAFSAKPEVLQKLKDINTIMRVLPDAPSINPSGTAKTLMGLLKVTSPSELLGNIGKYMKDAVHEQMLNRQLNADLAKTTDQVEKATQLQKLITSANKKIDVGVKAIFNKNVGRGVIEAGVKRMMDEDYKKHTKKIAQFAYNPNVFLNHLQENSKEIGQIAPLNTQHLNNAIMASVQFLNNKIPQPKVQMPFSKEFEPSPAQKHKFEVYYQAVSNPISVLADVRDGTLTNESMEALNAVHPDLLQDMRERIIEEYDHDEAKAFNFSRKMSLSKFMGQPMSEHLLPQVMGSYQAAFQAGPTEPQAATKIRTGAMKEMDKTKRVQTRTNAEDQV
jgi:hypothetical protein